MSFSQTFYGNFSSNWWWISNAPAASSHQQIQCWLLNCSHFHPSMYSSVHYNAVNFLTNIHKTSHSLPVRARYGVSFVSPAFDWYSASVPAIHAISYYIGLTTTVRLAINTFIQFLLTRWHYSKWPASQISLNLLSVNSLPSLHTSEPILCYGHPSGKMIWWWGNISKLTNRDNSLTWFIHL